MELVLDSYSLMAFFQDEPGAEKVSALLAEAALKEKPAYLCVVNWGEIYYLTLRRGGKLVAQEAMANIQSLPIELVPADRQLTQIAAELKASHKMSYADAFAAALAKQKKAHLVTGDREFKPIEDEVKILWL